MMGRTCDTEECVKLEMTCKAATDRESGESAGKVRPRGMNDLTCVPHVEVRELTEDLYGPYVQVHFSTPAAVCTGVKMHPYIRAVVRGSAYRPLIRTSGNRYRV